MTSIPWVLVISITVQFFDKLLLVSSDGGTGRRTGLKILGTRKGSCRFDSGSEHGMDS